MYNSTLFLPPAAYTNRIKLQEQGWDKTNAELLLQVELSFALMEQLGLDDEPITAVWAILSGMFIRHPNLENLSAENKRAIANARQIVPFSARFSWLNALRNYITNIPGDRRNYNFDLEDLDNQIINAAKNLQQNEADRSVYEICLSAKLEFRRRKRERVEAGTYYQFESQTNEETVTLQIKFTREQIITSYSLPWFDEKQNKSPVAINISDLEAQAELLDRREERLAQQYDWPDTARGNWVRRFNRLNYHKVLDNNIVDRQPAQILNIEGFTHIAGMVASGKSTLSLLLAANTIKNHPDRRITIVVGDTQSAIKLANQINSWFCDDPETDDPVAVPILGRSQRDKHLQGFSDSDDYLAHLERGQPHWGERWLSVVCPLQARISQSDRNNILNGKPLKPGTEPCHSLRKAPKDKTQKAKGKSYFFCPLFDRCPSQQAYRDMPKARVWITTPGAMAFAGMPYHYELRPIKMGELIYEQSDIVIFDEVDTIIEWFDEVYAEQVTLTDNGKNGVFDNIGVKTEQSNRINLLRSPLKSRWSGVQRYAQTVINATLTLLSDQLGLEILQKWTQQGYFTPHVLFYKLARRLAGLEEFDSYAKTKQELQNDSQNKNIRSIMNHFDDFLREDPLSRRNSSNPATKTLLEIIKQINNTGESATAPEIYGECRNWITTYLPNTERNLNRLRRDLDSLRNLPNSKELYPYLTKDEDIDTIETLAYRLQFTLTVTLLDRHIKIVFYEWQNRPNNIREPSPHRRMPSAMTNILPLPVTGRQFGTYYSKKDNNALTIFAYSNIGRDYVLNYYRLLTDFDGRSGPNVLALSGTSYLPDSTTFHVGDPHGILMPESTAQEAIQQSKFQFIPQFNYKDKPIRISGNLSNKKKANSRLRELARSLVNENNSQNLISELQNLEKLGKDNPELWEDRDRALVLVNSYEQSKWVADEIRKYCPSLQVYSLVKDSLEPTKDGKSQPGELKRADIETFGHNEGKILVAPTSSIGRGFNILNSKGKAAFGSIYFLTRPYPHPNDTQAIAREMNRRAYDWLKKEDFIAWQQGDGIAKRAELLRKTANTYWRSVEQRSYYRTLRDNPDLCVFPRHDLAATTLGRIIQAVGRLIRGGVPFHGYFVDSAWADNSAKKLAAIRIGEDLDLIDTEETSLLVATILRVCDYAAENDSVGNALYKPLADALENIENLFF